MIGTFLQPAKKKVNGEKTYICPGCNNGSGETGDGLCINPRSKYGGGWKCFACGFSGNVIDLYMLDRGVDYNTAFTALAEELGIEVDPWTPGRTTAAEDFKEAPSFMGTGSADKGRGQETAREAQERPGEAAGEQEHAKAPKSGPEAPEADYTAYYTECRARLEDERAKSYLAGRGISIETARRYRLGFDPKADPAKSGYPAPRIIIPTSRSHYVGRAVDPKTAKEYQKMNVKGGTPAFFNQNAIYAQDAEAVFIVEGAFDALSVAEVGQQAAALNSTNNAGKLIDLLQAALKAGTITPATFVICLDTDDAGKKACQVLRDGLHRLNLPFIVADICPGGAKDPNEALTADRDAFAKAVAEAARRAATQEERRTGEGMLDSFLANIMDKEKRPFEPIPTGIKDIDKALDGGFLRKTLVTLGAPPAMGKTTLATWVFETMASAGNDVIYINLEMSREQLLAKSLSRLVWKHDKRDMTFMQVLRGYAWTPEEEKSILAAAERYRKEIAPHFIYNPDGTSNKIDNILMTMHAETARLKAQGKKAPLVCLDYLQLVDSGERDAVEGLKNVIFKLKEFAINENTLVFVIIANNRASNKTGNVDMESGRDTSALEYSGDCMLGLAFTAIDDRRTYPEDEQDPKKRKVYDLDAIRQIKKDAYDRGEEVPAICREVSLKVVKSRFTDDGRTAKLIFDGKHSTYNQKVEDFPPQLDDEWETLDGNTPFL